MTRAVAAALALAGAAAVWAGLGFGLWSWGEPGAGLLPAAAGAAVAVFAGLDALAPGKGGEQPPIAVRRLLGHGIGILLLAPAMEIVGTVPAILALFVWTLRFVERLPWHTVVPVAVAAAAGSWALFEWMLSVPLPRGIWWDG